MSLAYAKEDGWLGIFKSLIPWVNRVEDKSLPYVVPSYEYIIEGTVALILPDSKVSFNWKPFTHQLHLDCRENHHLLGIQID